MSSNEKQNYCCQQRLYRKVYMYEMIIIGMIVIIIIVMIIVVVVVMMMMIIMISICLTSK